MEFVYLTDVEAESAKVRWLEDASKVPALTAAACAAGFSEWEVRESPLGLLEEGFHVAQVDVFRRGARVLVGMNGSTLIEVLPSGGPSS